MKVSARFVSHRQREFSNPLSFIIGTVTVALFLFLFTLTAATTAKAQNCPSSPNYIPDFSSNQNCFTFNNNGAGQGYPGFYPSVSENGTVLRLTPNQPFWASSAWYNTQQPVSGAFTTTFSFQLTGANEYGPADGIAFVIQNSSTSALGPNGCGIGFGNDTQVGCTTGDGIPNSLAIEINSWQNVGIDPSNSFISIQNCSGTGQNSVDPGCRLAINDLTQLASPINVADGNVHTVTVNYSGPATKLFDVIIDNIDLFPKGVAFDISTIGLNSGNAWVGFTASTGAAVDNQDILSWNFQPGAQTGTLTQGQETDLNFPNAGGNNVYSYTGQLTAPYGTPTVQVQPILMSQSACDAIVDQNFWPARCFVYDNAENTGLPASVMFEVTCPDSPGGTCGSQQDQSFFAELGTVFEFSQSENPWFIYPGLFGFLNPFPGWLKGSGPDPLHPCTAAPGVPLFQSNQIDTFFIDNGTTKGQSGGTGSCWVTTYDTPGEIWPGVSITSPKFTTYKLNQQVTANYTCSDPATSKPLSSPVGPYLTAASCKQTPGTNSCTQNGHGLTCTGPVDTSKKGLHFFTVTAIDSGGNQNFSTVIYNVK